MTPQPRMYGQYKNMEVGEPNEFGDYSVRYTAVADDGREFQTIEMYGADNEAIVAHDPMDDFGFAF